LRVLIIDDSSFCGCGKRQGRRDKVNTVGLGYKGPRVETLV